MHAQNYDDDGDALLLCHSHLLSPVKIHRVTDNMTKRCRSDCAFSEDNYTMMTTNDDMFHIGW